jgi:hypothetical protein
MARRGEFRLSPQAAFYCGYLPPTEAICNVRRRISTADASRHGRYEIHLRDGFVSWPRVQRIQALPTNLLRDFRETLRFFGAVDSRTMVPLGSEMQRRFVYLVTVMV